MYIIQYDNFSEDHKKRINVVNKSENLTLVLDDIIYHQYHYCKAMKK